MTFLLEMDIVCFFRARSKAIQQLRDDWVAAVLPSLVSGTHFLLASKSMELKEREES